MKQAWFAPKPYGYGAGLPIRWQGWVLLLGYIAGIVACTFAGEMLFGKTGTGAGTLIGMVLFTPPFILIAKARTEGGWRWRNGREGK